MLHGVRHFGIGIFQNMNREKAEREKGVGQMNVQKIYFVLHCNYKLFIYWKVGHLINSISCTRTEYPAGYSSVPVSRPIGRISGSPFLFPVYIPGKCPTWTHKSLSWLRCATTLTQRGYDNVLMLSGGLRVAELKYPEALITDRLSICFLFHNFIYSLSYE